MKEVQGSRTHQDGTAEGGSRQRENHGKKGMSNQPLPASRSRGGCQGRRLRMGHAVAVTTQAASDGSRENTMRVANIENNSLNWVSISSAGAVDITNCDFSGRRARDEMIHVIGSSEPDVIIGSDKDRNRGCKKKDKDHIEFLCELYEAQACARTVLCARINVRSELENEVRSEDHGHAMDESSCSGLVHVRACCVCRREDQGSSTRACERKPIRDKSGVRLQSKCTGTHRHARVDAEDTIGRKEQTGTWVRQAARAIEEQLKKDKQELRDAGTEARERIDSNKISSIIQENAEN